MILKIEGELKLRQLEGYEEAAVAEAVQVLMKELGERLTRDIIANAFPLKHTSLTFEITIEGAPRIPPS